MARGCFHSSQFPNMVSFSATPWRRRAGGVSHKPQYVAFEITLSSHVCAFYRKPQFPAPSLSRSRFLAPGSYALPVRSTLMHGVTPPSRARAPAPPKPEPSPTWSPSDGAPAITSHTASEVPGADVDGYESDGRWSELGDEEMAKWLRRYSESVAHQSPGQEERSMGGAAASRAATAEVLAVSPASARASGAQAAVGGEAPSGPGIDGVLAASHSLGVALHPGSGAEASGAQPGGVATAGGAAAASAGTHRVPAGVEAVRGAAASSAGTGGGLGSRPALSEQGDRREEQDRWAQDPKEATKLPVAASPAQVAGTESSTETLAALLEDAPLSHELCRKLHDAMTTVLSMPPRNLERLFQELRAMRPGRSLGEALRDITLHAWKVAGVDRATVVPLLVASRCSICEERLADAPACPKGCLMPMCSRCAMYWYRKCPGGSPRCPGEGCAYLLTVEELRAVGFGEAELEPWHAARVPAAFEGGDTKLLTCASGAHLWKPTAQCTNAVAVCRTSLHPWRCSCGAPARCTGCGDLWHPAVTCEKLARLRRYWQAFALREEVTEERIRELQKDEGWKEAHCKLCPKCGAVTERRSGCTDMTCGKDADGGENKQAGCGEKFRWDLAPPYRSALLHQEEVMPAARSTGQLCRCGDSLQGLSYSCVHCEDWHVCFECFSKMRKLHKDFLAHPETHALQPFRGESLRWRNEGEQTRRTFIARSRSRSGGGGRRS